MNPCASVARKGSTIQHVRGWRAAGGGWGSENQEDHIGCTCNCNIKQWQTLELPPSGSQGKPASLFACLLRLGWAGLGLRFGFAFDYQMVNPSSWYESAQYGVGQRWVQLPLGCLLALEGLSTGSGHWMWWGDNSCNVDHDMGNVKACVPHQTFS